ncbi:hypothetical protein [Bosea sp. LjRoot9]|uniref:hypothetical protein n=1 Tax=Bosea sp. LjRoot9 TaxID=3342341 RepID=UPI003F4F91F6
MEQATGPFQARALQDISELAIPDIGAQRLGRAAQDGHGLVWRIEIVERHRGDRLKRDVVVGALFEQHVLKRLDRDQRPGELILGEALAVLRLAAHTPGVA